jgi:hypothetical protein
MVEEESLIGLINTLQLQRKEDHEAAKSTIQGKKESKDFDVFLC